MSKNYEISVYDGSYEEYMHEYDKFIEKKNKSSNEGCILFWFYIKQLLKYI